MRQRRWAGTILTLALLLVASLASAATDKREIQAREAFAAGRYAEALDVFVKLYAEKVHPNYLRNIARCYQNLGEPDKAISSFREYLRQSKSMLPAERKEIEGYIKEMEELKQQRAASPAPPGETAGRSAAITPSGGAATTASASPGESPAAKSFSSRSGEPAGAPSGSLPMARDTGVSAGTAGTTLVRSSQAGPGPAPADEARPVYTRWWFWTLIGAAVVGGVVAAAVATDGFSTAQDGTCAGICK